MGRFVSIEQRVYDIPTHYYGVDVAGARHHVSLAAMSDTVDGYEYFTEKAYKAPRHVYGVDTEGKWHHLSHRTVLEYHGYAEHPTPQEDYETRLATQNKSTAEVAPDGSAVAVSKATRLASALHATGAKVAELPRDIAESYKQISPHKRRIVVLAGVLALGGVGYIACRHATADSSPAVMPEQLNLDEATGTAEEIVA